MPLPVVMNILCKPSLGEQATSFAADKVVVRGDYLAALETSQSPGFFAKLFTNNKMICSSAILGGAYIMYKTFLEARRTKWEELKDGEYGSQRLEYLAHMFGGGFMYFIGLGMWDES